MRGIGGGVVLWVAGLSYLARMTYYRLSFEWCRFRGVEWHPSRPYVAKDGKVYGPKG